MRIYIYIYKKRLTQHIIQTLTRCKTSHFGKLTVTSQKHPGGGQKYYLGGQEGLTEGGGRGASGGCRQRLISGLLGDKELMKERKAPPPQQQQQPGPAFPPPSAPKIPAARSHGGSHPSGGPPGTRSDPPLRLLLGQEVLRDPPSHRQSLKCSFFCGMKRFFKVSEKNKRKRVGSFA